MVRHGRRCVACKLSASNLDMGPARQAGAEFGGGRAMALGETFPGTGRLV